VLYKSDYYFIIIIIISIIMHTSTMSISSLSFMLSTVRHPWLMKKYRPGSIDTSSFSAQSQQPSWN